MHLYLQLCLPLLLLLLLQVASDQEDPSAKSAAALLFETALLESGFDPDDPKVGVAGGKGAGRGGGGAAESTAFGGGGLPSFDVVGATLTSRVQFGLLHETALLESGFDPDDTKVGVGVQTTNYWGGGVRGKRSGGGSSVYRVCVWQGPV
jgi:hypothetical protein